jgi:ribose 5-phosphate isomerase B
MNSNTKQTIVLATDHAGFELKEAIKKFLESEKFQVLDVGAHELVPEDDYPIYMSAAAMKVAQDLSGNTRAIIFGGSGQGEAIVANRFPGVRAVVWYGGGVHSNTGADLDIVKLSREHNDSNVLSIGARFVSETDAKKAVELWLSTPFSGEEKHARRITQIDSIE